MATQAIREKETGSAETPTIPYYVYDDGNPPADLSLADAITKVLATAPTTYQSQDYRTMSWTQQSDHSWRISMRYGTSLEQLTPLSTGQERVRFNFHVRPKFLFLATEVDKFPSSAPSMGGMINVRKTSGGTYPVGATIPVPIPNLSKSAVVTTATAASLAPTIAPLVGRVNSSLVGSYQAGELMLTSFVGQQRDDDAFSLDLEWSYQASVSGETYGDVTGVAYDGHDYIWAITEDVTDRNANALYPKPVAVYVNRPWPRGNLNATGITPP